MTTKAELRQLIDSLPDAEDPERERILRVVSALMKTAVGKKALEEADLVELERLVVLFVRVLKTNVAPIEPDERHREESQAWTSLSADAFARDWSSDEDSVYDRLQ